MPRFEPSEAIRNNSFSGKSYQDVIDTMLHAGFVPIRDNKHMMMRFYDPDAPTLTNISFMLSHNHGPVNKVYVKEACAKCMEVDRRNEERRVRDKLQLLPEWVSDALPHEFVITPDGPELIVARHERNKPDRQRLQTYRIQHRASDGPDTIRISCPANTEHAPVIFRYGNSNNYKAGLARFFEQYDMAEVELINSQHNRFQEQMHDLVQRCGFKRIAIDTDPPQIHLRHPTYNLDYFFVVPSEALAIPREVRDQLQEAADTVDAKWMEQETYLEQLKTQGWSCERTRSHSALHLSAVINVFMSP